VKDSLVYLKGGKSIGAQAGFVEAFNELVDFALDLDGAGDIKVDKTHWPRVRISYVPQQPPTGGIPDGWEEKEVNVVTQNGVVRMTVLVKSDTSTETYNEDVESWGRADYYKTLSIGTDGLVHAGDALFREGA